MAENTGKTVGEIIVDTERDNHMSADDALKYGLIDKIIEAVSERAHKLWLWSIHFGVGAFPVLNIAFPAIKKQQLYS